jgi:hypothetical protein
MTATQQELEKNTKFWLANTKMGELGEWERICTK